MISYEKLGHSSSIYINLEGILSVEEIISITELALNFTRSSQGMSYITLDISQLKTSLNRLSIVRIISHIKNGLQNCLAKAAIIERPEEWNYIHTSEHNRSSEILREFSSLQDARTWLFDWNEPSNDFDISLMVA